MKYALITGASSDIGVSITKILAKNNYNLILCYHSKKDKLLDNNSIIYQLDISSEESIVEVYNDLFKRAIKIDLLINLAGISLDNYIEDKTKEEFMKVLEVNVVGTFLCIKYFSKLMNNNGLIINMSSTDGMDTYSSVSIDYCVSKASINMLTKIYAITLSNIKVLAIAPNWVNTDIVREMNQEYLRSELKRIGQNKLIEVETISNKLIKIINDKNIETGSIIRIEE